MKIVTYERPVYYYETDRMDCVHHSNYIRWFEEARIEFMRVNGFSYEGLEAAGILSPVVQVQADYRSMARFGETVLIDVWIERYTGVRITWAYTVRDKMSGAVRCQGKTGLCFVNAAGKPVALQKVCPDYDGAVRRVLDE